MKIKIKNNIENKRKTKLLGELGECLASEQLRKNGFKNVRNLNDTKKTMNLRISLLREVKRHL